MSCVRSLCAYIFSCLSTPFGLAILVYISFHVTGCAINPATKHRELMIVSEKEEFRIGQQVDKQVHEETGIYLELPGLRSLVKRVGENIGRNSDRPNLIYRVEIADAPDFNAFALPGGFVYVYRGLLERINSVDELAAILGHEIAHVSARHSAAQISKAKLLNIGLLGLAIATKGAVQDYGGLLNLGAALAFNKFSRDDEREADYFGTRYMARAGYNPKAAVDVMNQIKRLQITKPTALEGWFMTHPSPDERLVNIRKELQEIASVHPDFLKRDIRRNEYISQLDGLAVGEWNGNEMVRGNRYFNKEFLLNIEIPAGWFARLNSKTFTAVFIHPKKGFYAFFNIEPLMTRKGTAAYFNEFDKHMKRLGLTRIPGLVNGRSLGHGAMGAIYKGNDSRRGSILVEGIAFVRGTNGFSLIGSSKEGDFKQFRPVLEGMVRSIRFMSEKDAAKIEPPRLRIYKVAKGDTWGGILQKYFGSSAGVEKLAEYNGLDSSREPAPGMLLKIPPALRFR